MGSRKLTGHRNERRGGCGRFFNSVWALTERVAARTFPLATVEPCIARLARSCFALLAPPAPAHPFVIPLQARGAAPRCLRERFSSPRRLPQALA